jgi:hypothetical protein
MRARRTSFSKDPSAALRPGSELPDASASSTQCPTFPMTIPSGSKMRARQAATSSIAYAISADLTNPPQTRPAPSGAGAHQPCLPESWRQEARELDPTPLAGGLPATDSARVDLEPKDLVDHGAHDERCPFLVETGILLRWQITRRRIHLRRRPGHRGHHRRPRLGRRTRGRSQFLLRSRSQRRWDRGNHHRSWGRRTGRRALSQDPAREGPARMGASRIMEVIHKGQGRGRDLPHRHRPESPSRDRPRPGKT